jgi:Tfp pilus assembly protein PilF
MERKEISEKTEELNRLCVTVRKLISLQDYEECKNMIYSAMEKYPYEPEPHNLIGILLEKKGDHLTAMKHFRTAWALDPTYIPARQNLDCYGTFYSSGKCAYDESDCEVEQKAGKQSNYEVEYDAHGVGHFVRRV